MPLAPPGMALGIALPSTTRGPRPVMAPLEMTPPFPVPPRLRQGTSRAPAGELDGVLGVPDPSSWGGPDAPRRGDAPSLARGGPGRRRPSLVGGPSWHPARETSPAEESRPLTAVGEAPSGGWAALARHLSRGPLGGPGSRRSPSGPPWPLSFPRVFFSGRVGLGILNGSIQRVPPASGSGLPAPGPPNRRALGAVSSQGSLTVPHRSTPSRSDLVPPSP